MSDSTASLPGRVVRVLWLLLAALDGCLLVYLTVSYRWTFDVPVVSSHLGGLADAIMYAALAALTALVIAIVVAIGTAIVREFRPPSRRSRLRAGLAFVVLLIPLLFTIFEWVRHVLPLVTIRDTARLDRFEVFERFVEPADSLLRPAGLVSTDRISIGLYLAVLLGVAYLAEKYSLAWLRVRWPVPIVPIAMVASLVWVTRTGERVQREFVASREWRPVAEAQTFPDALRACEPLGPDWTLPRPSELRLYTSTSPDAVRAWKGALWTNTVAERAANRGVVVEVAPRRSGVWRIPDTGQPQCQPVRDRRARAEPPDRRVHPNAALAVRVRGRLASRAFDRPRDGGSPSRHGRRVRAGGHRVHERARDWSTDRQAATTATSRRSPRRQTTSPSSGNTAGPKRGRRISSASRLRTINRVTRPGQNACIDWPATTRGESKGAWVTRS